MKENNQGRQRLSQLDKNRFTVNRVNTHRITESDGSSTFQQVQSNAKNQETEEKNFKDSTHTHSVSQSVSKR